MIGKLKKVPLREIWRNEAQDFSTWLAENIDTLNEEIGLSLSIISREKAVGDFSLDLIAEDSDGQLTIIENQLEKTNHDHLGKVVTYLSNMDADNLEQNARALVEKYYFGTYLPNMKYKNHPDHVNDAERFPESKAYNVVENLFYNRPDEPQLTYENKKMLEEIKKDIESTQLSLRKACLLARSNSKTKNNSISY